MFARTLKEFDQVITKFDRSQYYEKPLIAPPVITIPTHKYHLDCGIKLAYALLFEVTGKPEDAV